MEPVLVIDTEFATNAARIIRAQADQYPQGSWERDNYLERAWSVDAIIAYLASEPGAVSINLGEKSLLYWPLRVIADDAAVVN